MNLFFLFCVVLVTLGGIFQVFCQLICGSTEMRCESEPKCIKKRYRCDSDRDCGPNDDSDERDCLITERCSDDNYGKCHSGYCLRLSSFCDGVKDCPGDDNSDEGHCTCERHQIRCYDPARHQCIPQEKQCDGVEDCLDGSDEEGIICQHRGCAGDLFKCKKSYKCISQTLVCNEREDCGPSDTSDEDWTMCPCNGTHPRTFCRCPPGYYNRYSPMGIQSCVDIDECTLDDACHHLCHNYNGSHECTCHDGYVLKSDNKSCTLDNPILLYEWHSVIMQAYMDLTALEPAAVFPNIHGFDVDSHAEVVYFASATDGLIGRREISNVSSEYKVLFKDLDNPDLIAVDWVSNNLFVVSRTGPTIMICSTEESKQSQQGCATLYKLSGGDIIIVRGIAVVPEHGWMFWIQMGYSSTNSTNGSVTEVAEGSIWRGNMDGSGISLLTNHLVQHPVGIAIDHLFGRVFWIDSLARTVQSMNFDGSDRTIVIELVNKFWRHVRGLTVFEDQVLWIDRDTIIQCTIILRPQNLSSKAYTNCTSVRKPFLLDAEYPKILHPLLQPKGAESPCKLSPCRFICTITGVTSNANVSSVPSENGSLNNYKCICPDGTKSVGNNSIDCIRLRINTTTATNPIKKPWEAQSVTFPTRDTATVPFDSEIVDDPARVPPVETTEHDARHIPGKDGLCECPETASVVVTTVILVILTIATIQAVICSLVLKKRSFSNKTNYNLVRSYMELQNDSAVLTAGSQIAAVTVPVKELIDLGGEANNVF